MKEMEGKMAMQLEFIFEEKSEIEMMREKVESVRESGEKVRKSLFARHADLQKKYLDLSERLQIIERNICRG